jgi:protein-L-isoaspartate(D-aspartate) O-methyltransferase
MGFRAKLYFGDGYEGKAIFAPYDRVLVTCGAPFIPQALVEQLKVGGMLVIPVGEGAVQKMIRITRINETEFKEETFGDFSFVPMLENKAK